MTDTTKTLRQAIWSANNPYSGTRLLDPDMQGWRVQHPILMKACERAQLQNPASTVRFAEIGVWKGAGTLDMLRAVPSAEILSVDTFRGSSEHWLRDKWQTETLGNRLYDQFRSNMIHANATENVTPLPLDSINAAHVCAKLGLVFDVTHIDGAHDYESVLMDLRHWCGLSKTIVCDDYAPEWPDVVRAVDDFCEVTPWRVVEDHDGKCLLEVE